MRTIGDISMRSGNLRVARDTWTAAQSLFERAEQTRDFAGIEERLMFSAEKSSRRIEDKQLESEETRRKEVRDLSSHHFDNTPEHFPSSAA
jgi:hypothetical protein